MASSSSSGQPPPASVASASQWQRDWQRWIQEAQEVDFEWLLQAEPLGGSTIPNAEVYVVHKAHEVSHGPIASRWQQWCAHFELERATFVRHEDRDKRVYGQLSYDRQGANQHAPNAAALYLKRSRQLNMCIMLRRAMCHPMLAVGSEITILRGKVNAKTAAEQHESVFNIKFSTVEDYTVTVGYSRHEDGGKHTGITHAWIMSGRGCTTSDRREAAMDLMLNLAGFHVHFQPWAPRLARTDPAPALSQRQPMAPAPVLRWRPKEQQAASSSTEMPTHGPPAQLIEPMPKQQPPQVIQPCVDPMAQQQGEDALAPEKDAPQPMAGQLWQQQQDVQQLQPHQQEEPHQTEQAILQELSVFARLPAEPLPQELEQQRPQPQPQPQQHAWQPQQLQQPQKPLPGAREQQPEPLQPLAQQQPPQLQQQEPELMQQQLTEQKPSQLQQPEPLQPLAQQQPLQLQQQQPEQPPLQSLTPDRRQVAWSPDKDEEIRVGSDNDVSDHDREATAQESEAEEVAFMKLVRAVRRTHAVQRKIGHGVQRDRFVSHPAAADGAHPAAADDDSPPAMATPFQNLDILPDAHMARIHTEALKVAVLVSWAQYHEVTKYRSYVPPYEEVDRDFISTHGFWALGAMSRLTEAMRSADGDRLTLLRKLPDTDFSGRPISAEIFQQRWQGDAQLLLKHLFKKHEGEIIELDGQWVPMMGHPPISGPLFHPQFATSESQWHKMKAMRKSQGKGTGKGVRPGSKSTDGDKGRMSGGKGSKSTYGGKGSTPGGGGKGSKSATGDESTRVLSFREGVPPGYNFAFRQAWVVTLPTLLWRLSHLFTAQELYSYYCSCRLLANRREHSWANPVRAVAASYRMAIYGHRGHRRS